MKLRILLAVFAATTLSVMGQGTVAFQNGPTSPVRILRPNATNAVNAFPSDGLVVGLFYGTTTGNVTNLAATALIVTFGAGGVFGGDVILAMPGYIPGDILFLQVAAWDASYGASLAGMLVAIAAQANWGAATSSFNPVAGPAGYGVFGAPLQYTLGPTNGPATPMFGSQFTTGVFHFFAVGVVPEPSTLALVVVGLAGLGFPRRRRK